MRRAIFTCGHDWNSPIQIGDHHLARGLAARGWEVAFISSPLSPLHVFSKANLKRRFNNYLSGGERDGNVWHYVPGALAVSNHNSRMLNSLWLYHNWHHLTVPGLIWKLKKNGFSSVDLLCIRDPKFHFLLEQVQSKKSVYRLADRDEGFDHYNIGYAEVEKKVCSNVDTVLYTAHSLRDYGASRGGQDLRYFPHGVDWKRFALADTQQPFEYAGLSHPIAVYVGSIEEWFDFDLIANAARQLPHISFVIIGPMRHTKKFDGINNILLLGPRPYNEIPAYLRWADIGLIPFNTEKYKTLINSINPIKLYEYFAAGLPVLSAKWDEIERIDSPAQLYENQEQFISLLRSLDPSKTSRKVFSQYAEKLDWSSRVIELESI